jgi:hypothetical protein
MAFEPLNGPNYIAYYHYLYKFGQGKVYPGPFYHLSDGEYNLM